MKNKSDKDKFNPTDCGLVERKDKDGEIEYLYIGENKHKDTYNKIIGKLYHTNYWQGLPSEWTAYKIVHCFDGNTKHHVVFDGKIPTNSFGKQLIKNLFYE